MQIQLNDSDEITGFSMIGKLDNGVDYSGEMPDGFEVNFKPRFYLLKNNQIITNPNYSEPTIEAPMPTLTQQDEINAHFFKMGLDFKKQLKELESNG